MVPEKILVFSDSHGSTIVMQSLLESPPEGLSAVFHLGDGAKEAERLMRKYPMYAFLGVRGNCDACVTDIPETVMTERGGVRFMLTHGHKYHVKATLANAVRMASDSGARVLLYGHTHVADDRVISFACGDVRAVNPGSVRSGEYGLLTVDNGNILCELLKYRPN